MRFRAKPETMRVRLEILHSHTPIHSDICSNTEGAILRNVCSPSAINQKLEPIYDAFCRKVAVGATQEQSYASHRLRIVQTHHTRTRPPGITRSRKLQHRACRKACQRPDATARSLKQGDRRTNYITWPCASSLARNRMVALLLPASLAGKALVEELEHLRDVELNVLKIQVFLLLLLHLQQVVQFEVEL